MSADDDIDGAVGHSLAGLVGLFGRDEARELFDRNRQTFEAFVEAFRMLTRKEGRRRNDRHLEPGERSNESCPKGNFGFSEANIADDKAVHWVPTGHVFDDVFDGPHLVFGFLVGETGAKLVPRPIRRRHSVGRSEHPFGGNFDQPLRHIADAVFHFRFARLPSAAAQFIKGSMVIRAIARQQFDILNRQIELGLSSIFQRKTIVRRAHRLDGLQTDISPHAMLNMDNEVTRCEAACLRQKVFSLFRFSCLSNEAITKNILLGNDRDVLCLKPLFETPDHQPDLFRGRVFEFFPSFNLDRIFHTMISEHGLHPISGTVRV